jgi:hypothetical protein
MRAVVRLTHESICNCAVDEVRSKCPDDVSIQQSLLPRESVSREVL